MKISEKHGLNPSINVCFFCGQDKDLIIFGKLKGDAKAPTRVVANYEPCDHCKEIMAKGVTLIEVTSTDSGAVPIQKGLWPTGRWCVIKREAAERLFKGSNTVLIDEQLYSRMISQRN